MSMIKLKILKKLAKIYMSVRIKRVSQVAQW